MILALLLVVAGGLVVHAQQAGSLADAARQARTQKTTQPEKDMNRAQQVANQLSEDQNSGDAPGGFKTYNAGDYKLWVPAPYTVEGHDDGGTVLAGPSVGSKHVVVLAGTPMVSAWGNNDTAFHDAAVQFASLYLTSAKCTKTTYGEHAAYQCGLAGASLLGRHISGNAMFVQVGGYIYPVFCAAPTDSRERDILNDPNSTFRDKQNARAALEREDQDVRSVWKKCDTVFQSIRVSTSNVAKAAKAQPVVSAAPAALAQAVATPVPQSVAAPATTTTVPAGFKVHAFKYCSGVRQCWDASVLVPVDAQLVSSGCQQYAFEVKVQGSPFLLMTGAAGGNCNGTAPASDPVRWHQLVDPESQRAPGTYVTISSWQAQLDGRPAIVTTIGFRKLMVDWMGRRAEVEANGVPLVVGCMAPKEHFTDGEAVCSALIDSLRLP
jgi:hypothetical protein